MWGYTKIMLIFFAVIGSSLLGIAFMVLGISKLEELMNELNAAIARLEASVQAANAKIDSLKESQADPVALNAAVIAINNASDVLDAKVASV